MSRSPFLDLKGLPYYSEPMTHLTLHNRVFAWEFNGWKAESLSWKEGCYIHGGLSDMQFNFTGPDVIPFFESICTNSFAKFPVGAMKHVVMCIDSGEIATHGILQRSGEQELQWFAGGDWPIHMLKKTQYDVKWEYYPAYLFQVAGPTSLATLERATGESLADIKFFRYRNAVINGKTVEIARLGMSGNLAYEIRGPLADGPEIYDAVYQAGKELGCQRLGWRTYLVNHVEGGFPQQTWTFSDAIPEDPTYQGHVKRAVRNWSGSVDPADRKARYRSPFEVNWDSAVRFDHDFVGRAALEREAAAPRRKTVTLRWNAEDVTDVYASLLRPGEEYKTMDLPTTPTFKEGFVAHADHIFKDGRSIGVSSGTIYSYHFRQVLSMGCIDIDQAEIGNTVVVHWGDYGGRIKEVRATVEAFPYFTDDRNNKVEAEKVGTITKKDA